MARSCAFCGNQLPVRSRADRMTCGTTCRTRLRDRRNATAADLLLRSIRARIAGDGGELAATTREAEALFAAAL